MVKPPTGNIRVLTWNIHKGFSHLKRVVVIHALREAIEKFDPDLIFLQEVSGKNIKYEKYHSAWPKESHAEFLANGKFEHAYGQNASYAAGHHGNAILSKFKIASSQQVNISTNIIEQRGFLYCKVGAPGMLIPLHCFSIHLGLLAGGRKKQFTAIINYIKENIPDNEPLIIAGDFNDWPKHTDNFFATHINAQEVFLVRTGAHAYTFPSKIPFLCLDRIYVRGVDIESVKEHSKEDWGVLSDHIPISAMLSYPIIERPEGKM